MKPAHVTRGFDESRIRQIERQVNGRAVAQVIRTEQGAWDGWDQSKGVAIG